jgi:hypothetical protein
MPSYQCFECRKVRPFTGSDHTKCEVCGSGNIELLSPERITEGREHGVFYNIDPKTGKRAKPKRR